MEKKRGVRKPKPMEPRFWSKIDKSGDCWLWTPPTTKTGYGRLSREDGSLVLAHRYSWELVNGPIPKGRRVLHRCDVRNCVNPNHLFLGTQGDNVLDAVNKGRHRPPTKRKINEAIVREVRALVSAGETHQSVADRFGVARSLVSLVVAGKRWGRVA